MRLERKMGVHTIKFVGGRVRRLSITVIRCICKQIRWSCLPLCIDRLLRKSSRDLIAGGVSRQKCDSFQLFLCHCLLSLTPAPVLVCPQLREVLADVASLLLLRPLTTSGYFFTFLNRNVHSYVAISGFKTPAGWLPPSEPLGSDRESQPTWRS